MKRIVNGLAAVLLTWSLVGVTANAASSKEFFHDNVGITIFNKRAVFEYPIIKEIKFGVSSAQFASKLRVPDPSHSYILLIWLRAKNIGKEDIIIKISDFTVKLKGNEFKSSGYAWVRENKERSSNLLLELTENSSVSIKRKT